MCNKNKDLFENKFYDDTPKYLYKVMKKCYYDIALNYGDLSFIYTLEPSVGTSNNIDLQENISSCVVCQREYIDKDGDSLKMKQEIAYSKMCYCFTMNIHEYLSRNPLSNDDVVLRFNFEDVLKFFRLLPIKDLTHGKISYTDDTGDLHYEVCKLSKEKRGTSEETVVTNLFKKRIEFMQENEYRFICSPMTHVYTILYSLDLKMEMSILHKSYPVYGSDSGYLIKFLPTIRRVHDDNITVSDMVRELFSSAKVLI